MPSRARRLQQQPAPADKKTHAADRRDGAEPKDVCDGEHVKGAGEKENADKKTPPWAWLKRLSLRQDEQHHGMDEMVEHGFFPDGDCAVLGEQCFKAVRAKGAEGDGEEAHEGGEAGGKSGSHFLINVYIPFFKVLFFGLQSNLGVSF